MLTFELAGSEPELCKALRAPELGCDLGCDLSMRAGESESACKSLCRPAP